MVEQTDTAGMIESLRALSAWLIANDHDMRLPDGIGDPDEAATALAELSAKLVEVEGEMDAALAFARSEAARNETLTARNKRHEGYDAANYGAVRRMRDVLTANGYCTSSYFGVRQIGQSENIGEGKYTAPLKLIEEFVSHLLGRATKADEALATATARIAELEGALEKARERLEYFADGIGYTEIVGGSEWAIEGLAEVDQALGRAS